MDRIEDKKIEKWRGSCYGITLVTILDKLGKIGFNENLKLPADTMYQVSTPISQREILSQINFYQILWQIPKLKNNQKSYSKAKLAQGYSALVNEIKNSGLVQLNYYYKIDGIETGHSIIAYRCTKKENGNYVLWTYNPNYYNTKLYEIESDFSSSNLEDKVTKLSFASDFSIYSTYDYDGENNDEPTSIDQEKVAVLEFSLNQNDFTLTNAEGEKTYFNKDNDTFTGDLEVINFNYSLDTMMIYVNESSSFALQTEDEFSELYVLGHDVYAKINGTNIQDIMVLSDGTIQLNGQNMVYSVTVNVHDDGYGKVKTSDSGSGIITINRNN